MIDFYRTSFAVAILGAILSVLLLLFPDFIFFLFNVETGATAQFIARRAGVLFLGLAAFGYFGRNAEHSLARQAICLGITISMTMMAVLGIYEFVRGFAGIGILGAVIVEFGFGYTFGRIWVSNK